MDEGTIENVSNPTNTSLQKRSRKNPGPHQCSADGFMKVKL